MTSAQYRLPFGTEVTDEGVRFRLWAPTATSVALRLGSPASGEQTIDLERRDDGWCEAVVADARAGDLYAYEVNGSLCVPDPASRHQPRDVHGPSEIIDPDAYVWHHGDWCGRPWEEVVLYELHVGTFTPAGTFRGVIDRLDHLVDLGVTAIELMPVADFPGRRDWGYNGTLLFAPDASYGRPEDLKALIDAAHGRGLMVFLDVVYNHFGPEGNYLGAYASSFFDESQHTPWGAAINFGGPAAAPVRSFFIENACFWLCEYRFDGLRFDAVHAITDPSEPDILTEIAETVAARVASGRHVHLVLENDNNEARRLVRASDGAPRLYVAQWDDDYHHIVHVLETGESAGYYADYGGEEPGAMLGRCLAEGYVYQGQPSPFRCGERRGEPSAQLPPTAFVAFVQNHDQIGNRAFGDRLARLAPPEAVQAATALLLLAPSPPMLFMGEEWASVRPFLFFCDFGEDLQEAVREGRRREFAAFPEFADPAARETIPDPTDTPAFEESRIDWSEATQPAHARAHALHRELLAIRKREIMPRLRGIRGHSGHVVWADGRSAIVTWRLGDGTSLEVAANLGPAPSEPAPARSDGTVLYAVAQATNATVDGGRLPAWSVTWRLHAASTGA